ncbi:hypothetical protein KFE25_013009 [Diacronema lutheri]|uniref:Transmembrane protein 50A n=1 Tax=Diacronema lutheri TaxID=2081491 RepID=A0A8J5X9S1_DIALT|nr:hypothetical protein KFE25_013009 [Diacronema lutheri]
MTLAERGVPVASIGSLAAGLLFGIGWYVWIDGCAWASHVHGYNVNGAYWVPGLLQTLSLVMVNVLNWGMLSDDAAFDTENSAAIAKCWVFSAFVVAFSGVIGAVWIMVNENNAPSGEGSMWPAVAGLLQNVFIFLGSLIFRFARMQQESSF